MNSLKQLALNSSQVICVAYADKFSIDGKSIIDLEVGCRHGAVSSNQEVLNRAESGSIAIVTSQSRHFVMGILGKHIEECNVWKREGGSMFKYAREFTPITNILPIESFMEKWKGICDVEEVQKQPKNMFNARFCGYGSWYIKALHSAIEYNYLPIRTSEGTHMLFE